MGLIILLIVGGVIGWIASMIMRTDAQQGVFLAFQYPVEIPGVSNNDFPRLAVNKRRGALGARLRLGEQRAREVQRFHVGVGGRHPPPDHRVLQEAVEREAKFYVDWRS